MTIGTVQASPLTMANVYATMGANGVECTPIAITKVTDRSGSKVKVPSANCHQAIDPDIAQTVSYALNQGVVQPGGEASTTQLDNNRKTFAKTGTNENTVMATAGFVPNQSRRSSRSPMRRTRSTTPSTTRPSTACTARPGTACTSQRRRGSSS